MVCKSCGSNRFKTHKDIITCVYCGREEVTYTTNTNNKTILGIAAFLLASILIYIIFSPLTTTPIVEKNTIHKQQNSIQVNNTNAKIGSQIIQSGQDKEMIQVNNTDAIIHKQIIQKNKNISKDIRPKKPVNKTSRILSYTQTIKNSKGEILYHKKEIYPSPKDCYIDNNDIPHTTLRTKEPTVYYSNNGLSIDNKNIAMSEQKISTFQNKNGTKYSSVLSKNTEPAPLTLREEGMRNAINKMIKNKGWNDAIRAEFLQWCNQE